MMRMMLILIVLTLVGIVIVVNDEHPLKADSPNTYGQGYTDDNGDNNNDTNTVDTRRQCTN